MRLGIRKQAVPLCRYVQYSTVCHACACNAPRFVLDPTNYRTILPPSSGFLLSKTPALTDLVKPHFYLVLPQAFSPVCPSVCLCPAFEFFYSCICTSSTLSPVGRRCPLYLFIFISIASPFCEPYRDQQLTVTSPP
jgi:hypothetical protein